MNVSSSFKKPFQLKRFLPGSYTNGKWAAGVATTLTVSGSIQPAKGYELLLLPEGDRSRGSVIVKMDSAFQFEDEATGIKADQIYYGGHWYQVQQVQQWQGHSEAIALRIENK